MADDNAVHTSTIFPNQFKRPTFEEYTQWAINVTDVNYDDIIIMMMYKLNSNNALTEASGHPFFASLSSFINKCDTEYKQEFKHSLLMNQVSEIKLDVKTYQSMKDKSYRFNVIENADFNKPSIRVDGKDAEWLTPENWYYHINDILRTRVVCKYLDGPKILSEKLIGFAHEHNVFCECDSKQRDSGYYAFHFYVKIKVPLLIKEKGIEKSVDVDLKVEIQLTTQLQEVMDKLTHPIYEASRINPDEDRVAWKWDHTSDRFKAGYMGHTLHMLEGIILEIRDKNTKTQLTEEQENAE